MHGVLSVDAKFSLPLQRSKINDNPRGGEIAWEELCGEGAALKMWSWWHGFGTGFARRSFTQRSFTRRIFYTEKLVHREDFTHRVFTQRNFYTGKALHTEAFTQRSLYTE